MAQNGGARPGAGRKKGGVNKLSAEAAAKAKAEGIMPLDFMLGVMRDDGEDQARRLDAAKSAAPYVHAKLSAITVDGKIDGEQTIVATDAEGLRRAADAFDRLAAALDRGGKGAGAATLPH
jgi:hypothetical protein